MQDEEWREYRSDPTQKVLYRNCHSNVMGLRKKCSEAIPGEDRAHSPSAINASWRERIRTICILYWSRNSWVDNRGTAKKNSVSDPMGKEMFSLFHIYTGSCTHSGSSKVTQLSPCDLTACGLTQHMVNFTRSTLVSETIVNYTLYTTFVSASGWSLVQRIPTEGGVSECDLESPIMRRPWPTGAIAPW